MDLKKFQKILFGSPETINIGLFFIDFVIHFRFIKKFLKIDLIVYLSQI